VVLTFSDLIEVRFLDAFRRHGVKWKAIRTAAKRAKELLGRHHPFSTRIFKTDGRSIIAEISKSTGDKVLLNLVNNQFEFEKVVSPFLFSGLEFDELQEVERWWPLGTDRHIVIDPQIGFGAPIVSKSAVPTHILYLAFKAERDKEFVANWFNVAEAEVSDAVEFEENLAA
jgi:uncharacterized protein (DUF433 family)